MALSKCHYSNVSRGLRQKENQDTLIPCVIEPDENAKPNRELGKVDSKNSSLSRTRSGKVDPLTCPKCQGLMRIISIIEDQEVIDKILGYLGLCQKNQKPPPKPKTLELQIDYSDSQLPFYEDQDFGNSSDHSTG